MTTIAISGWIQGQTIAAIIGGAFLAGTFVVYALQLRTMRRSHNASTVLQLLDILQAEPARSDRREIYLIDQYNGSNWTFRQRAAGERVAQAFNSVGFMVEQKLVKPRLVIDNWSPSIIDMWTKVEPLILERRDAQKNDRLWTSFGSLAARAQKRHPRVGPITAQPAQDDYPEPIPYP